MAAVAAGKAHQERKKEKVGAYISVFFPVFQHAIHCQLGVFSQGNITVKSARVRVLRSSCRAVKFHGNVSVLIDGLIETDQKIECNFLLSSLRCNSPFDSDSLEISAHPVEDVSVLASFHIIFRSHLFSCWMGCH